MESNTIKQSRSSISRFLRRSDIAFVFHLLAFALFVKVWMWHTTPAALSLPGSSGFGWFFRYLTFWSYTLQLVQLACCVLAHLTHHPPTRKNLVIIADKLSCAAFGIANTVTAMFYAVENSTQGLVEGGKNDRPWWLATAVHALNSLVAWIDLFIVEERTFSGHSRHLAMFIAISYVCWLLVVKYFYGKFPYPVLNALPYPWGMMAFSITGILIVVSMFEIGKFAKHRLFASNVGSSSSSKRK